MIQLIPNRRNRIARMIDASMMHKILGIIALANSRIRDGDFV